MVELVFVYTRIYIYMHIHTYAYIRTFYIENAYIHTYVQCVYINIYIAQVLVGSATTLSHDRTLGRMIELVRGRGAYVQVPASSHDSFPAWASALVATGSSSAGSVSHVSTAVSNVGGEGRGGGGSNTTGGGEATSERDRGAVI